MPSPGNPGGSPSTDKPKQIAKTPPPKVTPPKQSKDPTEFDPERKKWEKEREAEREAEKSREKAERDSLEKKPYDIPSDEWKEMTPEQREAIKTERAEGGWQKGRPNDISVDDWKGMSPMERDAIRQGVTPEHWQAMDPAARELAKELSKLDAQSKELAKEFAKLAPEAQRYVMQQLAQALSDGGAGSRVGKYDMSNVWNSPPGTVWSDTPQAQALKAQLDSGQISKAEYDQLYYKGYAHFHGVEVYGTVRSTPSTGAGSSASGDPLFTLHGTMPIPTAPGQYGGLLVPKWDLSGGKVPLNLRGGVQAVETKPSLKALTPIWDPRGGEVPSNLRGQVRVGTGDVPSRPGETLQGRVQEDSLVVRIQQTTLKGGVQYTSVPEQAPQEPPGPGQPLLTIHGKLPVPTGPTERGGGERPPELDVRGVVIVRTGTQPDGNSWTSMHDANPVELTLQWLSNTLSTQNPTREGLVKLSVAAGNVANEPGKKAEVIKQIKDMAIDGTVKWLTDADPKHPLTKEEKDVRDKWIDYLKAVKSGTTEGSGAGAKDYLNSAIENFLNENVTNVSGKLGGKVEGGGTTSGGGSSR
jgi:hypothetical protein